MATPKAATKDPARKSAPKKVAVTRAKPSRKVETSSLRFFLSEDLHVRFAVVLTKIESSEDASGHHADFAEIIVEAVDEGLDYYFLQPVKVARSGFIVEQSTNLGLVGVRRLMAPVIRNVLSRMDHNQLISVASSIRELMK